MIRPRSACGGASSGHAALSASRAGCDFDMSRPGMTPLPRYLSPLSQGWLLPGMWVWNASFNPLSGITRCHAIQFASVGGGTVQFGTSDRRVSVVRHGAWEYREGVDIVREPAREEEFEYLFLRPEIPDSRPMAEAAVHEVPFGAFESIDVFMASHEINITGGTETVEVLAGLRFNMKRPDAGGRDRSIGFLHTRPGERFLVGFAALVFAELPEHVRLAETIATGRGWDGGAEDPPPSPPSPPGGAPGRPRGRSVSSG